MSEVERTPLIRLPVDQEVFIDTVRADDAVEDAHVATEVVAFDKVGDAYVLEGAIVFAGYLSRTVAEEEDKTVDSGLFALPYADEPPVAHVHHRMPFVLRVPTSMQPRGVLNVKSRVANWQLSVVGSGWLRVQGDLHILGLNDAGGYHFQCGAQEAGDIFFASNQDAAQPVAAETAKVVDDALVGAWRGAPVDDDAEDTAPAQSTAASSHDVPAEPELVTLASTQQDDAHDKADVRQFTGIDPVQQVTEQLSEARGGQDWASSAEGPGHFESETRVQPETPSASASAGEQATQELRNLDRFFATSPNQPPTPYTSAFSGDTNMDRRAAMRAPLAEFEFAHQVAPEHVEPQSLPKQEEAFTPSRGFTSEGFHATAGFVAQQPRSVAEESASDGALDQAEEAAEMPTWRSDQGSDVQNLWSFVDFNAPEKRYTLRYVVVLEEETLQMVADRTNCLKSALVRANQLETEQVTPGQTLMVPEISFAFAK